MFEQMIKDTVDGLDKKFNSRLSSLETKIDSVSSDLNEIKIILRKLK
ncbi:hypothetical protein KKH23_08155 [Patescibacteria group bacterium]|nr:hypothetical protein [Patescibacteria group bacterium]